MFLVFGPFKGGDVGFFSEVEEELPDLEDNPTLSFIENQLPLEQVGISSIHVQDVSRTHRIPCLDTLYRCWCRN